MYIRESCLAGIAPPKKRITLKISLKWGNHALPQDWGGGFGRGNAYKLNQPGDEYICFCSKP